LLFSTSLSSATISEAGTVSDKQVNQKFELKAAKAEANKQSLQKTTDKRKEIVSEAVSALRETQDALKALDEGKSKEAVAGLERATGKLEIVLARDPKVALVPMDVRVVTSKIECSLDDIKKARQAAENLLKNGQLQEARSVLMNLASETIISTVNLPMATYPDALKKAAKLIDENKLNEAKEVLQAALDTLVISDTVIPLPVVDAKISLQKADDLAKMKNRTAEQNKQLSNFVSAADTDIQFAEALGYGSKSDFESFHKQIAEIRQKTADGKSGIGFFDQIKNYLESMNKNSQHKAVAQK
jgi:hypothetical protein